MLSPHLHAGKATWRGTHPQFCLNLLRTRQARLGNDVDDLRWHADWNRDGVDDALASYVAVTDLFGARLHNAEAVSLLGILLAATADDVAAEHATLSEASHLAGFLCDAGHSEDLEAALVASASTPWQG